MVVRVTDIVWMDEGKSEDEVVQLPTDATVEVPDGDLDELIANGTIEAALVEMWDCEVESFGDCEKVNNKGI